MQGYLDSDHWLIILNRPVQPNLTFQEVGGLSVCMPGDADHPDTSNLGNFH